MDRNTPAVPDTLARMARGPVKVVLVSFGYRHPGGVPDGDGLVIDLRHKLRNPPDDPAVRARMIDATGLDAHVRDYVRATPGARQIIEDVADRAEALLTWADPRGEYVTVMVGCQGGRHRSVVVALEAAAVLTARGIVCEVEHRDVDKDVIR